MRFPTDTLNFDTQPAFRKHKDEATRRRWCPLDAEALCAAARRHTGLQDFGDPAIPFRLAILLKSIEHEANLHPLGRFLTRFHLRDLLRTRLLLEQAWKDRPDLAREPITAPIFITGMPRSGSTFLQELLAQDPANRTPRVWEVMSPLPARSQRVQGRILRTAMCLWWFRQIAPQADSVHPLRASTPHECVAIHSYTLLSREFATMFNIPAYEGFLEMVPFDPAYVLQKRFLQLLQAQQPPRRWVLKAPDHVFSLEALLRVFPDAVIIRTQRDPLQVVQSSSRMIEVLQRTFSRPRDRREIGIHEAQALADGFERFSRFRDRHPELAGRLIDVDYDELTADPLAAMREIYAKMDRPLGGVTIGRIYTLSTHRSRYRRGKAGPTLADLGIEGATAPRRFAECCGRWGLQQVEKGGA